MKKFEPRRKQLKAADKKNVDDSTKDLHFLESKLERIDEAEDEESSREISTKRRSGRTSKKIVANTSAKELEPPKKVINTKSKKNVVKKNVPKWKANHDKFSKNLAPGEPSPLANLHSELVAKNPINFFHLMFTAEMSNNLVEQSELYAHRDANCPSFSVTIENMRQFFGILLISNYHFLPNERDYWRTAEDLGSKLIAKMMSRNRFQELKQFCHVADNQSLANS